MFGALAVGAGVAAFEIGEHFETAFHSIQQQTGATGDALGGLEESFKKVFASTPGANFKNVADAVSEISVRTGLTGDALDTFAQKEIELGKITKTDVGQNVKDTTALFGLFGVAAENQAGKLDVLFKASQVAGVSLSAIDDTMKAVAPVAQMLGFSFDQTAAMVANLSKMGLPAGKVMAGLSKEFAAAAKAGKDPTTVINDMVDAIKRAPDATQAAILATKEFGIGARQAATLVAAVRAGTMDFGDTLAKITSGGGGIDATTRATMSLGDKLSLLKNKALVALEPISMGFLDILNVMVDGIEPAVGFIVDVFEKLGDIASPIFAAIRGGVMDVVDGFRLGHSEIDGWGRVFATIGADARDAFDFLVASAQKAFGILKGLWDDVVAGFEGKSPAGSVSFLTQMFYNLGGVYRSILDGLQTAWANVVEAFHSEGVQDALQRVKTLLADVGDFVKDHLTIVFAGLGVAIAVALGPVVSIPLLIAGIETLWQRSEKFRDVIHQTGAILTDFGSRAMAVFHQLQDTFGPALLALGSSLADFARFFIDRWDKIRVAVLNIVKILGVGLALAIAAIVLPIMFVWNHFHDQILAVVQVVWRQISIVVSTAVRIIGDIFDFIISILTGKWGDAWNAVKDIFAAAFDYLIATFGNLLGFIVDFFSSLPGNILGALGDLGGYLVDAGQALLAGLLAGVTAGLEGLLQFFVQLPGNLLNLMLNADVWLIETGVKVLVGLVTGVGNGAVNLMNWFIGLPGTILGWIGDATVWLLQKGIDVVVGLWNAIASMDYWFATQMMKIPGWIIDSFGNAADTLHDIAVNIVVGFWHALESMKDWVVDKVKGFFSSIWDGVTGFLGIGSPSKKFMWLGQMVGEGFATGIEDMHARARDAVKALTNTAADAASMLPGITGPSAGAPSSAVVPIAAGPAGIGAAASSGSSGLAMTNALLRQLIDAVREQPPPLVGVMTGDGSPESVDKGIKELRATQTRTTR